MYKDVVCVDKADVPPEAFQDFVYEPRPDSSSIAEAEWHISVAVEAASRDYERSEVLVSFSPHRYLMVCLTGIYRSEPLSPTEGVHDFLNCG